MQIAARAEQSKADIESFCRKMPPGDETVATIIAGPAKDRDTAGRVLSRDTLMDLVKGQPLEAFDRSIDVHVSRIRAAIEDEPKKPRRLITVRGAGYVFARQQS